MVAYNFQKRFVEPIRAGLGQPNFNSFGIDKNRTPTGPLPKRQTIRATGKRRHARPGDIVQLYCGMRTRNCFPIGVGRCTEASDITLTLSPAGGGGRVATFYDNGNLACGIGGGGLDIFARADGFQSWAELLDFWRKEHGDLEVFTGKIIQWEAFT